MTTPRPLDPHDQLRATAEGLADVAAELGLPSVAERIRADSDRRLDGVRLRVLVLGEIKHGKSSLVNALIGNALLPTGVTPTTGAVVRVERGREPGRWRVDPEGRRESLPADRFEAHVRGADGTAPGQLSATAPGPLPEGIELVDTPGLNDLDRFRSAVGGDEASRADVILLVLDATQVLTRTELAALRDAIAAVGGLDGSGATLELVVNRIDLVADRDRAALVEHLRRQLVDLLPSSATPFLTDARRALREPDAPSDDVREVARLRARLAELAGQSGRILPARMRTSLLRHERLLGYNAAIQARALTLDDTALREEISAVRAALAGTRVDLALLREQIDRGAERIAGETRARVDASRRELEQATLAEIGSADLRELTDVLPGALKDAFAELARRETEALRVALDALTHEALKTHGDQARRRVMDATLRLGFRGPTVYVEPPSVIVEAGILALGVVGTAVMYFGSLVTGLAMMIASPLSTMILREKSIRDARVHARQVVPPALEAACTTLADTADRIVREHARALDEHITLASRALGEQLAATLEQAVARLRDPAGPDAARARLAALEARLGEIRERLLALAERPGPAFEDFATPSVIH